MEQHVKDHVRNLKFDHQYLDVDHNDQSLAYDYNEVQELLFEPASNDSVFIVGETCSRKEEMLERICQDLCDRGIEKSSILFLDHDLPILHGEDISCLIDEWDSGRPEERLYLVINEVQLIDDWPSLVKSVRMKHPRVQMICSASVAPSIYETLHDQELDHCKVVVLSRKNESNTKNATQGFGVHHEFKFNVKDGMVEIKGLTPEGKGLSTHEIPSEINGFPVKVIASGAFHHRKEMMSITIPECIVKIGDYAFTNCSGLSRIVLPRTLTYIGDHSFLGAENLEEIIGGSNINHIGNSAFYGTKWYADHSSDLIVLGKTLHRYLGTSKDIVIPDSIRYISSCCFANSDIESVSLPSKIKIEEGTFYNCRKLRHVHGLSASRIPAFCFFRCEMLEKIDRPIREIGKFGLYGCKKLRSLDVDNARLESGSVAKCSGLKVVTGKIIKAGKGSFFECSELRNIDLRSAISIGGFSFYKSGVESVDMQKCHDLGDYAFGQCTGLKEFSIRPSSVIGIGALFGSDNVSKMTISGRYKVSYYFRSVPRNLSELIVQGNIVDDFNRNCTSLKRLSISNAKIFGRWSFYGNTGLEAVAIFKVKSIGDWAFARCDNIREMDLPDTVIHIGMNAFRYCHVLSRMILRSNTVVTLGVNALYATRKVTLTVPAELVEKYSKDAMWSEYASNIISI